MDRWTSDSPAGLNPNLEMYLFVCSLPPPQPRGSLSSGVEEAPPAQTLVSLVALASCFADCLQPRFVTDICEPKTEPFWQE